jgi:hypothetical protein
MYLLLAADHSKRDTAEVVPISGERAGTLH